MTDTGKTADAILVTESNGFVTATFNRPRKKNALTHAMYTRLVELLHYADNTAGIRALCLRGAGQCFSSGNDLGDFLTNPPSDETSPVIQFLHGLIDFKKPLIAVIEGAAVGIGTTMLLHCDLVYATASATFQMPFTKLALCPEAASSYLLPKVMGLTRATELLLLSKAIDASEALQLGLLTEILPDDTFEEALGKRLETLAALPPEAVRTTKDLLRAPLREAAHEAVGREAAVFSQRLASAEAAEAMQAFLERRQPDFSRFT